MMDALSADGRCTAGGRCAVVDATHRACKAQGHTRKSPWCAPCDCPGFALFAVGAQLVEVRLPLHMPSLGRCRFRARATELQLGMLSCARSAQGAYRVVEVLTLRPERGIGHLDLQLEQLRARLLELLRGRGDLGGVFLRLRLELARLREVKAHGRARTQYGTRSIGRWRQHVSGCNGPVFRRGADTALEAASHCPLTDTMHTNAIGAGPHAACIRPGGYSAWQWKAHGLPQQPHARLREEKGSHESALAPPRGLYGSSRRDELLVKPTSPIKWTSSLTLWTSMGS
ncbi:hypothetical protein L1887_62138 [Cichorium endivia]|nr:hypothetical protein L1887_62138 [Cichorium endivia]